jgi:hypothetical protein
MPQPQPLATVLATVGIIGLGYLWYYKKNKATESDKKFHPTKVATSKRVLVLGDGNLSWSLATVRSLRKKYWFSTEMLVITTFDTLDELHERYPNDPIDEIIVELNKGVSGTKVEVAHHVDATNLATSLKKINTNTTEFDLIIFNFPHWGGRGYIQRNRKLLKDFFLSVQSSKILASQGEIHLALKQGQGGTPVDLDLGNPGNTWKSVECGAGANFVLAAVDPFVPPDGYYCSGRRGTQKSFWLGGALNHVFVHSAEERRPQLVPPAGIYPTMFTFDVSFWILDEMRYTDADILTTVMESDDCVRSVEFENEIWAQPRDSKIATQEIRSMVFRIKYQSQTRPMSREQMTAVHDQLREKLGLKLCPIILVRGSMAFQQPFIQNIRDNAMLLR